MTICQMDLGREGWGWVVWQDRRGGSEISEAKPEKRGLLPGVRKGREAIWDAGGEGAWALWGWDERSDSATCFVTVDKLLLLSASELLRKMEHVISKPLLFWVKCAL